MSEEEKPGDSASAGGEEAKPEAKPEAEAEAKSEAKTEEAKVESEESGAAKKAIQMKEKAAAAAQGKMMASVDVMITELSQLKALLAKAEVELGDIYVTLGVPPSVNADVKFPDMDAINKIPSALKGVKLSKAQKSVVDSVVMLAKFRESAQSKFKDVLGGFDIRAGFPPTFVIRLKDVEVEMVKDSPAKAAKSSESDEKSDA